MDRLTYEKSRDTAWRVLIKYGVNNLLVKVSELCKGEGLHISSYAKGRAVIEQCDLQENCRENDGFLFRGTIFYNEKCSVGRQRFTIAHELRHFALGHKGRLVNREPDPKDNPKEEAANVFASRILAPACVMWGLGVDSAKTIEELCDISKLSAPHEAASTALRAGREVPSRAGILLFFTVPVGATSI